MHSLPRVGLTRRNLLAWAAVPGLAPAVWAQGATAPLVTPAAMATTAATGTPTAPTPALAAASASSAPADPGALLRQGGVAVLLRHAQTTPGTGDPAGLRLGDCATQRNLSDAGRRQARRIGAWFGERGLRPAAVRSSAWCRCIDTAMLAFGRSTPWPPLHSFFGEPPAAREASRAALARALAASRPAPSRSG